MSDDKVDYGSAEFSKGYEDGYLRRAEAEGGAASYKEGYAIGHAERDAPRGMVPEELYIQRHGEKLPWRETKPNDSQF